MRFRMIFVFIISILGAQSALCMNDEEFTLLTTGQHVIAQEIVKDINKLQSGDIAMNAFIISHQGIKYALKRAAKRGINISILASQERKENKEFENFLKDNPTIKFTFAPGVHSKSIVLKGFSADQAPFARAYIGSANFTFMSLQNMEADLKLTNPELVDEILAGYAQLQMRSPIKRTLSQSQQSQSSQSPLSPMRKTPLRPTHTTSKTHNLIELQAERIKNAEPGAHFDITSMNLNDAVLMQRIEEATQRGITFTIYVDASGARGKNLENLRALAEWPGIDISVYQTDEKIGGKYTPLQHAKIFMRTQPSKENIAQSLLVMPTLNLTEQARREFNEALIIPDMPPKLHEDIQKFLNVLHEKSTPLANYIPKSKTSKNTPQSTPNPSQENDEWFDLSWVTKRRKINLDDELLDLPEQSSSVPSSLFSH